MTEEEYNKAYNDAIDDADYVLRKYMNGSNSEKVIEALVDIRTRLDKWKYPESPLPTHIAKEPINFDVSAFKKAHRHKCTVRPITIVLLDGTEYTTFMRIHSYRGCFAKKNYEFTHYYNGYLYEKYGKKYPVSKEAKNALPNYLKLEIK